MKRALLCSAQLCATTFLLAAASPAVAQVTAEEQASDVIVVTARRREESLQDVPSSVQVIGQEQINSMNARSLAELNGATPNVSMDPQNGTITIRGISSNARNAGFEAGAAVYIDGVYQGRPVGNNQNLVDIAQVEVLRGPQGTLFGKNTTAGAYNITTVRPGDEFHGSGYLRLGEQDQREFAGYVAGPLVEDVLGGKLAVFRQTQDGYQHDSGTGRDYGNVDAYGARAELNLTVGGWDLALRGDYSWDLGEAARQEPVQGPLTGRSLQVSPGIDTIHSDIQQESEVHGGGLSFTAERDLGFATLTSITAWRELASEIVVDDDYGTAGTTTFPAYVFVPALANIYHHYDDEGRHFSQEIRLASPSDSFVTYVAGLYYFSQELDSRRDYVAGYAPNFFINNSNVETTAYAAFANVDLNATDRLTFTAGLRYTHEEKDLAYFQQGNIGYPTIPQTTDSVSDNDLSPALSVSYHFTSDVMGYATASRGYKSGGWNPELTLQTTVQGIRFESEQNTNYELGLRTQFFDRQLTVNATLYHMDYTDLQVSRFLGAGGLVISNAGEAAIEGLELEAIARPTTWLRLSAGAALNEAKYGDFNLEGGAPFPYSGQDLTNSPRRTGFVAADIDLPIASSWSFLAHGDYRYIGERYFNDGRTHPSGNGAVAESYAIANVNFGIRSDNGLEIIAYANNIGDERGVISRSTDFLGYNYLLERYTSPRQVGVRIGYSF
ncbi:MAG: TonB-dependent receptor [Hyphomonadaceae bacterium]|nr:TonB-dependent receptor [Hyphomonadaceae bacterium]